MRVSFIGGGNMAEAMICGLIKAHFTSQELAVYDINPSRLSYLKERYKILAAQSYEEVLTYGEIVVLAVKPKDLPQVMEGLSKLSLSEQLTLSVVAGASLSTLSQGLRYNKVVRVMPNINAQVGEAISLWASHPEVSPAQREMARLFLSSLGKEIYVEDEVLLDMATALSGSGPAYVFMFIESLIDAGVCIGLPRKLAEELTIQTVLGSMKLLKEANLSPAEAKFRVVSPGGTTAEALYLLEESGFRGKIIKAVAAAYQKARKL